LKKGLLVYGDIGMDLLLKTPTWPDSGEDVKVEVMRYSPGGSAANCAAVASRLGVPTNFLGTLGDDPWAVTLNADLNSFGVDTSLVHRAAGTTGSCVAAVTPNGEKRFFSFRGVNETAPPPFPDEDLWNSIGYLHLSGYSFQSGSSRATANDLVDQAKRRGIIVSLDPSFLFAQDLGSNPGNRLESIDYLFPNREEAALLSGQSDPTLAARWLRERGVKTVVIKLDREGCFLASEGVEQFITLKQPDLVTDTTGAGDAFCGGFLAGLLGGFSLLDCCKVGAAAASHIISYLGAHEHAPSREAIMGIIRMNQEEELSLYLDGHWN
jgi:sugar/nucleoside kinase (ribokinase family)